MLYDNESELTDSDMSEDPRRPTMQDVKNRLNWDTNEFEDSSSEGEIRVKKAKKKIGGVLGIKNSPNSSPLIDAKLKSALT